jgi:hypothetical protein
MPTALRGISLAIFFGAELAAQIVPPQVPENLKPPATEALLMKALGKGKQIYACQASPQDQTRFEWVLERPEADLFNTKGEKIGKHYKGPTWESNAGKVTAEIQQRAQAPRAGAVPWLLLKAKSVEGPGAFGRVTYIQRVDTMGGAAPADGCDHAHAGKEAGVDYQADYYFYGPHR